MMKKLMLTIATTGLAFLSVSLSSCVTSQIDPTSITTATALKARTVALANKALEPYPTHVADITALNTDLEAAYSHEKGRIVNTQTIAQWDLLLHKSPTDPSSGIWPRFLEHWQKKGTLKSGTIQDNAQDIGAAFDKIISLENSKTH